MILLLLCIVVFISLVGFLIFLHSGYMITPEDEIDLKEALSSPIPELLIGTCDIVKSPNGVSIYYESIGDPNSDKGTLFLVNGLGLTLLDWPMHFLQPLLDDGFHIIRFDNRDVGMSDRITSWGKGNYYNLEDMAIDAMSIVDHLNITKFHLIGLSMGGMISQRIAINHPDRVLSLCSIMSTGHYYDPELTSLTKSFKREILRIMLRYGIIKSEKNALKTQLSVQHLLKGKGSYRMDNEFIFMRSRYEINKRKGFNPKASRQQGVAIAKSGSRYNELKTLDLPTLIVHGNDDPLILVEHAHKYAGLIPRSQKLIIDGMGHDLQKRYTPKITSEILKNIHKAHS